MPSASSPVRGALQEYAAGRLKPERLVIAVAAAYYGGGGGGRDGGGERARLQPLVDVIDRASPGIVDLASVAGGSGFEIRVAERPFPKEYETELRRAVEAVLAAGGDAVRAPAARPVATSGLITRLLGRLRRLFSASA